VRAGRTTRVEVTLELGRGAILQGAVAIVEPIAIPALDSPMVSTQIDLQPILPVPARSAPTNPFKRFFKKLFHV